MEVKTVLQNLNHVNGADLILFDYANKLLTEFPDEHLYGCEMGIAYGGGVEGIGRLWKERGTVYGFDTFEDLHPKHLAADINSFEATCMDFWYIRPEYGYDHLKYAYERQVLDDHDLKHVILVKGEVNEHSCDNIPKLHYAFLDMDMPVSMANGYKAVRDKVVKGGYLFLHDTQNIPDTGKWFKEAVQEVDKDMWTEIGKWDGSLLVGLQRT